MAHSQSHIATLAVGVVGFRSRVIKRQSRTQAGSWLKRYRIVGNDRQRLVESLPTQHLLKQQLQKCVSSCTGESRRGWGMLERLAAWFLNTYVADYVGNVDTDQLSIGLLKGILMVTT